MAARARGGRARLWLVSSFVVVVVVAGAAAAAWLSGGIEPPFVGEKATSEASDASDRPDPKAEPVRLDELQPPRKPSRESETTGGSADVPPVIGVGTDEFAAQATDAPIVSTDADSPNADIASDDEIRRDLEILERENKRIEKALRNLGGSAIGTGELIWPVRGPLTSPFGPRGGRLHAGIDIGVPTGTPVRAADAGRVVVSGPNGGYGNYICIQHTRSLSTCYAHNSRLGARKGERVRQGQVIARAGSTGASTGPHLHFETRVNGKPVNPMRYL